MFQVHVAKSIHSQQVPEPGALGSIRWILKMWKKNCSWESRVSLPSSSGVGMKIYSTEMCWTQNCCSRNQKPGPLIAFLVLQLRVSHLDWSFWYGPNINSCWKLKTQISSPHCFWILNKFALSDRHPSICSALQGIRQEGTDDQGFRSEFPSIFHPGPTGHGGDGWPKVKKPSDGSAKSKLNGDRWWSAVGFRLDRLRGILFSE